MVVSFDCEQYHFRSAGVTLFLEIAPVPLWLWPYSETTRPGNAKTRTNFMQQRCSGNAAILARSHSCAAGMALKIDDFERAFPVQRFVLVTPGVHYSNYIFTIAL